VGASPASGPNTGYMGSLTSDGSTYDIYQSRPISQPITPAPDEFVTYWSIRQTQRVSGTVTTANHFNAWKALGAELGTFNYQLVATEGENSSGFSEITVD
jgi:endo-1,4-beta-xylanase